jgi:hypothetical protein
LIPLTTTGVEEFVVVPFPSCPALFRPQHLTLPSDRRAQLWVSPAAIIDEVWANERRLCERIPKKTIKKREKREGFFKMRVKRFLVDALTRPIAAIAIPTSNQTERNEQSKAEAMTGSIGMRK